MRNSRFKIILVLMAMVLPTMSGCSYFRSPAREKDCEKLLPRHTMIDLLTDVYLLESFMVEERLYTAPNRDTLVYYYAGLFEKYGVDPWVFEQTLDCYLRQTANMLQINEEILNRLLILESEVMSRSELERRQERALQRLRFNRKNLGYPHLKGPLEWSRVLSAGIDSPESDQPKSPSSN